MSNRSAPSIPEPKPRKDNRCVVCRKPITTITRYGAGDAFCASRCAREYFGTSLEVDVPDVKPSVLSQRVQAAKVP